MSSHLPYPLARSHFHTRGSALFCPVRPRVAPFKFCSDFYLVPPLVLYVSPRLAFRCFCPLLLSHVFVLFVLCLCPRLYSLRFCSCLSFFMFLFSSLHNPVPRKDTSPKPPNSSSRKKPHHVPVRPPGARNTTREQQGKGLFLSLSCTVPTHSPKPK